MNITKVLGLVAVAAAIVGAFVTIPHLATLLVILGLIGGFQIDAADHVRVIVSALALTALAGTLNNIPSVGSYLTAMVGNLGLVASGVAIVIILRNVYKRVRP